MGGVEDSREERVTYRVETTPDVPGSIGFNPRPDPRGLRVSKPTDGRETLVTAADDRSLSKSTLGLSRRTIVRLRLIRPSPSSQ